MVIRTEVKDLKKIDFKALLGGQAVYVGYPENSSRSDSNLTDAQIAFLNTNGTRPSSISREIKKYQTKTNTYSDALSAYIRSQGDPKWHIPPRPFVEPAIEKELPNLTQDFKTAILNSLEGHNISNILNRIGLIAKNAVQKFIQDYPGNGLMPNAPSTVKAKGEDHPLKGKLGSLLSHVTWIVENE